MADFGPKETTRRGFLASAAATLVWTGLAGTFTSRGYARGTKGRSTMTLTPYLLFDGNCEQAMRFYQSCLGGELTILKVKDSPAKDRMPASYQDRVLNARLQSGAMDISATDWLRPDRKRIPGNTVCLYLNGTTETLTNLFEKLSDGADVNDPLSKQFWGTYGALNDKFGVRWMFASESKGA